MFYFIILTPEDKFIEIWLPARFAGDAEKALAILGENGVVEERVA